MKAQLLLAVLVCGTAAADEPPDDKKLLQGTWSLVGLDVNGKPIGDSLRDVNLKVNFKDNAIAFQDKEAPVAGTFQIDPAKNPKTIDTTFQKDTVEKGIYVLEGNDTLKLCVAKAGGDRPKTFATKEGDGNRLFIFKRDPVKSKEKDK